MILHPGNMSSPAQLGLQKHGLDASNLHLLKDFNIGDKVTPADAMDCAEAALVKPFEESQVVSVNDMLGSNNQKKTFQPNYQLYTLQGHLQTVHNGRWTLKDGRDIANVRSRWKRDLHRELQRGGQKRSLATGEKLARRKENTATSKRIFTCIRCNRDHHSRVCLYSRNRCCAIITNWGRNLWAQTQGLSIPMDTTYLLVELVKISSMKQYIQ